MKKLCKKCKKNVPRHQRIYCDKCLELFRSKGSAMATERQQEKIQCRICKEYYILLAAHTVQKHGLTGREYRKKFGYDVKKGLIPEHYRKERQALNKKHFKIIKKNLANAGALPFKKGHKPNYKRSSQTIARLVGQAHEMGIKN